MKGNEKDKETQVGEGKIIEGRERQTDVRSHRETKRRRMSKKKSLK